MNSHIRKVIKEFVPPIFLKILKGLKEEKSYGFFGNYNNWQDALKHSRGYDDPAILNKVKASLIKVRDGSAQYERDSVIFEKIEYSWPVLASLLWIASQNNNQLNIIDFGGSLGSSYFQNRKFLTHLNKLNWNIVEQKKWVDCGNINFKNTQLNFFASILDCLNTTNPNAILLSSVIQYLEKPYEFLENLTRYGFKFIIFDRTTFLNKSERLTVQKVRPGIYDATYPAWFLNENRFHDILEKRYALVADFESLAKNIHIDGAIAFEKGYIFHIKR